MKDSIKYKKNNFIKKHRDWFWYTPEEKLKSISDELLLENVINYGSIKDFKDYIKIVGIENASKTFWKFRGSKKKNLYPELYNLFDKYFKKIIAQRNIK
jgi:hypothetical protein